MFLDCGSNLWRWIVDMQLWKQRSHSPPQLYLLHEKCTVSNLRYSRWCTSYSQSTSIFASYYDKAEVSESKALCSASARKFISIWEPFYSFYSLQREDDSGWVVLPPILQYLADVFWHIYSWSRGLSKAVINSEMRKLSKSLPKCLKTSIYQSSKCRSAHLSLSQCKILVESV